MKTFPLEPIEKASRKKLRELQLERLRWSVRRAWDKVPYYRKKFEQAGVKPSDLKTLADLARETGLSRFQVLRGFVRATGLTPHAYIVQRRIDRARGLIARGSPLAAAALASGFADQSHMTRVFVQKYGVSPGAYANAVA